MAWTVTQIVTEVQKRTGNKANNLVDFSMEFFLALDDFCGEQHFWWRKKRGNFTAVIGTASYDLSSTAGGSLTDFAELDEVSLLNPDGVTISNEIFPITDPVAQIGAVLNTVQDTPAAYFIDPQQSDTTMVLQAPSSVAQKVYYTYWAIPQNSNLALTAIPLVPGFLHWGLLYALERRILGYLYGTEDPRYVTSEAMYQDFIVKAAQSKSFTTKATQECRTNENYTAIVQAHQ